MKRRSVWVVELKDGSKWIPWSVWVKKYQADAQPLGKDWRVVRYDASK